MSSTKSSIRASARRRRQRRGDLLDPGDASVGAADAQSRAPQSDGCDIDLAARERRRALTRAIQLVRLRRHQRLAHLRPGALNAAPRRRFFVGPRRGAGRRGHVDLAQLRRTRTACLGHHRRHPEERAPRRHRGRAWARRRPRPSVGVRGRRLREPRSKKLQGRRIRIRGRHQPARGRPPRSSRAASCSIA